MSITRTARLALDQLLISRQLDFDRFRGRIFEYRVLVYAGLRIGQLEMAFLETTREGERSSSSMRTDNPIDCTDEISSNLNFSGSNSSRYYSDDYNHVSSATRLSESINDIQDNRDIAEIDVVLMDRETANSNENVKEMTILLVGNSNAGKSSFVYWFRKQKFKTNPRVTTGGEPSFIGARINGQHYVVTLMDTAGTERFQSVPQSWYRYTDGAIVMYDITDFESFKYVTIWKQRVERNCRNDNIPYILVGNKVDIEGQLHIEGEKVAEDLKMDGYLKTSALTGEGINTAIKTIIALVSKSAATHQSMSQGNITTKLKNQERIVVKSEAQEIFTVPIVLDRVKRKTQRLRCC